MKFTKVDLDRAKNLVVALRRAKFDDVVGVEVLAFAQTFQWVSSLVAIIEKQVSSQEVPAKPPGFPEPPAKPPNNDQKVVSIKKTPKKKKP